MILGIGYDLRFNFLFRFIKSLRKHTRFDLGLGCAQDGVPHYEMFALSRTTIRNKRSTYFSLCSFGTVHDLEHIVFTSYFNLKYTGSVIHVPSVPSNNSPNFILIL